jgi:hypothetical protein
MSSTLRNCWLQLSSYEIGSPLLNRLIREEGKSMNLFKNRKQGASIHIGLLLANLGAAVLLGGCAVIAPADDVKGNGIALEAYSASTLRAMAAQVTSEGANIAGIRARFGMGETPSESVTCSKDATHQCKMEIWDINRINYGGRLITHRTFSVVYEPATGVIERATGDGYDKSYDAG